MGSQHHDFSPGNGENIDDPDPIFRLPGLFWLVRIGDESFRFEGEDNRTAVLEIDDLLEFDRFQIMGPGNVTTHLSFETTYQMQLGKPPTSIVPLSNDPTSPHNWAGTIWEATAKGNFSASYDDGTFSMTGTMDSALATEITPGHMGPSETGSLSAGRTRTDDAELEAPATPWRVAQASHRREHAFTTVDHPCARRSACPRR